METLFFQLYCRTPQIIATTKCKTRLHFEWPLVQFAYAICMAPITLSTPMSSNTAETEQFHHFASIGINYLFSNKINSDIRNIAPNKQCFVFAISPADCLHSQTTYIKK